MDLVGVIIMCQCSSLILINVPFWWEMLTMREAMHVCGQRVHEKLLLVASQSCCESKPLQKKSLFFKCTLSFMCFVLL